MTPHQLAYLQKLLAFEERGVAYGGIKASVRASALRKGWVVRLDDGRIRLTDEGRRRAQEGK
jgi:hypothetical protein